MYITSSPSRSRYASLSKSGAEGFMPRLEGMTKGVPSWCSCRSPALMDLAFCSCLSAPSLAMTISGSEPYSGGIVRIAAYDNLCCAGCGTLQVLINHKHKLASPRL